MRRADKLIKITHYLRKRRQAVTAVPLIIGFLGFAFVKIDSNQITNRIGATTDSSTEEQEALDVLRARYARGDIDQTEFESRLDDLLSTETVEQASEYRDEDLATEKSWLLSVLVACSVSLPHQMDVGELANQMTDAFEEADQNTGSV